MNERHAKVLAVLEAGPQRARAIARVLGHSADHVSNVCGELRQMGLARAVRGGTDGRSVYWVAIKGAEEPVDVWASLPPQVRILDARTAPPLRPKWSAYVFAWDGSWPDGSRRGSYQS